MQQNKQSGFTLIELLVVISIIGFLSSVILANLSNARDKGRIAAGQLFDDHQYQALGISALGTWAFSENTGTTVYDGLGNKNGTAYNTTWTTGLKNKSALKFNGSNSYVQIPNSTSFNNYSQTLTISAWVKLDAAGNDWQPITFKEGTGGRAWWFGFTPNSSSQIHWSNHGVSTNDLTCNIPDALGRWRHILVNYKNGVGRKMYVDGILICSDNTSGSIPITTGDIFIGGGGWRPINGVIQDVRIYSDIL